MTAEAPVIDILSAVYFFYILTHARTHRCTCTDLHYICHTKAYGHARTLSAQHSRVEAINLYLPHSSRHFLSLGNTNKHTLRLSSVTVIHQMALHPLAQSPHKTHSISFPPHAVTDQVRTNMHSPSHHNSTSVSSCHEE